MRKPLRKRIMERNRRGKSDDEEKVQTIEIDGIECIPINFEDEAVERALFKILDLYNPKSKAIVKAQGYDGNDPGSLSCEQLSEKALSKACTASYLMQLLQDVAYEYALEQWTDESDTSQECCSEHKRTCRSKSVPKPRKSSTKLKAHGKVSSAGLKG